jgi:anti-sigma regulatory factor (Ser/Thr protein kinase)
MALIGGSSRAMTTMDASPRNTSGRELITATPLATWPLSDRPVSAIRSRTLIRGALTVLGLTEETVDNAVLMVSELVTNALRHAYPPYELRIRRGPGTITCEVVDCLRLLPTIPAPEHAELTLADIDAVDLDDLARLEGGRGLDVVSRLCEGRCAARLTTTLTTDRPIPGKAVGFTLDLPSSCP